MQIINPFIESYNAIRTTLRSREYLIGFVIVALLIFIVLFEIQVSVIPGNSTKFQASLFTYEDWILFTVISIFNSLFVMMQVYLYQLKKKHEQTLELAGGIALSGVGTLSGFLASLFGAATCGLCIGALFSFLGANSVIFLIDNRVAITIVSLILLVMALIITSRRFNTVCESCR